MTMSKGWRKNLIWNMLKIIISFWTWVIIKIGIFRLINHIKTWLMAYTRHLYRPNTFIKITITSFFLINVPWEPLGLETHLRTRHSTVPKLSIEFNPIFYWNNWFNKSRNDKFPTALIKVKKTYPRSLIFVFIHISLVCVWPFGGINRVCYRYLYQRLKLYDIYYRNWRYVKKWKHSWSRI